VVCGLTISRTLANWVYSTTLEVLPEDVIHATKLRILDVLGLAFLGAGTQFGRSVKKAALAMTEPGPCHILRTGESTGVAAAGFANAAFASALEFDDFHIDSLEPVSSPTVAGGLALSETVPITGAALITAIAVGNEITCRIGNIASREGRLRSFPPAALFGQFGVTYLAAKALGLGIDEIVNASGICGTLPGGLLPYARDGAQSKPLQSGWAAHSGIAAAFLAWAGNTGPAEIFERWSGLFTSRFEDTAAQLDLGQIGDGLGSQWESHNTLFKRYPTSAVIQPYIRGALRLRARASIVPGDVERMDCPVAPFLLPIVAEPRKEKCAPASASQAVMSLPFSIAEAVYRNSFDRKAYSEDSLRNPEILNLARRVNFYADTSLASPGSLKGAIRIALKDGRIFEEKEEYNRASIENAMTEEELLAKFHDNARILPRPAREQLTEQILNLELLPDAAAIIPFAIASGRRADLM
jgi:2-methylcitrate dehydratase PrpD